MNQAYACSSMLRKRKKQDEEHQEIKEEIKESQSIGMMLKILILQILIISIIRLYLIYLEAIPNQTIFYFHILSLRDIIMIMKPEKLFKELLEEEEEEEIVELVTGINPQFTVKNIDFYGICDLKSIQTIIEQINPTNLILISKCSSKTLFFKRSISKTYLSIDKPIIIDLKNFVRKIAISEKNFNFNFKKNQNKNISKFMAFRDNKMVEVIGDYEPVTVGLINSNELKKTLITNEFLVHSEDNKLIIDNKLKVTTESNELLVESNDNDLLIAVRNIIYKYVAILQREGQKKSEIEEKMAMSKSLKKTIIFGKKQLNKFIQLRCYLYLSRCCLTNHCISHLLSDHLNCSYIPLLYPNDTASSVFFQIGYCLVFLFPQRISCGILLIFVQKCLLSYEEKNNYKPMASRIDTAQDEDLLNKIENKEPVSILSLLQNELNSLKQLNSEYHKTKDDKMVVKREENKGKQDIISKMRVYMEYRYLYNFKSKTITYEFENGQIERTFVNGMKEIRKSDGSIVIKTNAKEYFSFEN